MRFTVVIPAFNEESSIGDVLGHLQSFVAQQHLDAVLCVVDDGSTDGTSGKVKKFGGIRLITHPYNKGYGAAIKTGIAAAETEWCVTMDADGQHSPDLLLALLPSMTEPYDLVVGKREGYQGPWIRQPGKWLIHRTANYVVERKIPDFNSGLRAFRRSTFLRYAHLFPNGFSLSTTSTVCFFKENRNIAFVPVSIAKRKGKSTVSPTDAVKTIMLVLRLIMLFSPLRIFLPMSIILGAITIGFIGYELATEANVSDAGIVLIFLSVGLFFFGLLADQIAALRREIALRNGSEAESH